MAYTIISQNNSTTTLSDGVNTITVPSRVNLTSGNFTIVEVNNNMATLEDGDGNVYRDIPCVATLAGEGGGGGTVDKSKIVNADTIPTASADNAGYVYLYTGETDANYTHGYVYQNKVTTTYTDSITFDPASISGTTVTATAGALAGLCAEYGSGDITDIIKGTLTYDQSGDLLVFVGLDDTDTQVCTFQLYTQDYIDAGFTFTGTLQDGDVINFAGTITESSSYAWERIDVQPAPEALPDQTGQSGKFLTTDGTDASWAAISALQNTATGGGALTILGTAATNNNATNIGIYSKATFSSATSYGAGAEATGQAANALGCWSIANNKSALAVGNTAGAKAIGAIQINQGDNTNAGTMSVGLSTDGSTWNNYELLSSDGTIPTDRLTKVNTTITLAAADWSSNTQTVNVTGMTATGIAFVSPDPNDQAAYTSNGLLCTNQTTDSLTFTATTTPSSDIVVNVVML